MSIDMNTYGREIRKAIDEVASDSGNDWCIFGYEGKSYTLKVLSEGDGGVEEMVDEFHGSKIMYGYCKVKEPNTGLPKFVFVNWQGEGAPERMKFACGSHSSEVQRVCRIAHVTINARDDSDVDPNDIIGRVVKASGSQHSVLKSSNNVAAVEPVGSVYKKVNPTAEILNRERDAYWQKVEVEERKAKQEEEKRKREEKERIDREVRERDRLEAANRERRMSERNQQISQQRMHERQTQQRLSKQQSEQQIMDDVASDEQERRQRSASLKNERQVELANLIKQRNATGLEPSQKVGANYSKVDPKQEIMSSRDQYWMNLEAEEANRKEVEKRQRTEEAEALERSRREREAEDARRRENQERDRAAAIAQQRRAEREQANRDQQSKDAQARAIHQEAIADDQERQSRSERLRKERQEEAARLIGQRGGDGGSGSVSNARNFFLQQQQQRQSEEKPSSRPAPGRLPRVGAQAPVHQRETEPVYQPEPTPVYQPEPTPVYQPEPTPVYQPEPTPVYQPEPTPAYQPEPTPAYQPEPTPAYQSEPTPVYQPAAQQPEPESSGWSDEEAPAMQYDPTPVAQTEPDPVTEGGYGNGFTCRAIYDYAATEDDEISFNPGDIIQNIDQIDDGWWMGDSPSGHRGLFPSNYVKPI